MKIELDDIAFWMDAIRDSDDRYRTLDSFWKGQLNSKRWLVDTLETKFRWNPENAKVVIHGGWTGVLATMLFNSNLDIGHITSVDLDPNCKELATTMNKRYEMEGRFTAVTADMCEYEYEADIVINTSIEHITKEQYEQWLERVPDTAERVIIQSNNYYELDEHINCIDSLKELEETSKLDIYHSDTLDLPKYKRFMVIGRKP